MIVVVDLVLVLMLAYVLLGLVFAVFFYSKAAAKIDEGTVGTPWHFRLIIFPGVVLFWLALFIKWIRK